ncbi:MAG: pseudouridine synthase [Sterolibacteriaceae bacterium]|nr:pseudouridine synthase [Candidatus Methylophosphatis haderslevensis]
MPRRPTLKLPAKPRAEKTRSGTVRPNAPRPRHTGKTAEYRARPKPAPAPGHEQAPRSAKATTAAPARPRTSTTSAERAPRRRPDAAPRKPWDADRAPRPRRESADSAAPARRAATAGDPASRSKRNETWPEKRTTRASQPARAADDRPPRPARPPLPRAPSGAASSGVRNESRPFQARAKAEPPSPWDKTRPPPDRVRAGTDARRADERQLADKPRRPRADQPNVTPRPRPAGAKPSPGRSAANAGETRSRRPPQTDPRNESRTEPHVDTEDSPPRKSSSPELPRLSKRMSELGMCSRREADEWIENGWISVDGQVVEQLGTRVHPHATITVSEAARQHQSETVTILLHKPMAYVSGQAEDGYQAAAVLIRPETRWEEDKLPIRFKRGHLRGLAPAGRLDIDSTGLLVFTQDGRIAKRLVGEDSKVEKEYLVRVEGTLDDKGLALLNHGLSLDDKKLKPAHVSWQNEHQLRFVLREGKKRQIRRMCEQVGLTVTGLKRIRIGSVTLSKLPVGNWRYLRPDETF